MPATVTLSTTTLAAAVDRSANEVKLTSTTGVAIGTRLFVDGELMRVVALLVDPWVKVIRGADGTAGVAHDSLATVWIGAADQFYSKDPEGRPPEAIPVSPYINILNGKLWFARGGTVGNSLRWWQAQTVTREVGALGVETTTLDPTAST